MHISSSKFRTCLPFSVTASIRPTEPKGSEERRGRGRPAGVGGRQQPAEAEPANKNARDS